ncbi:hypothetical protein [Anaeromyxobacter oryzisoli]|uniref:hypothetical protein n=1 Tax=Anaeromyxobacter oryzisoli TaxID=2925408 RepID=UPI001F580098|nr:hypothetical protein [Anaeromyxobacter sp. SG63]
MALPGPKPARYWKDDDFDQLRAAILAILPGAPAAGALTGTSLDQLTAAVLAIGAAVAKEVDLGAATIPAKVYSALAAGQSQLNPVAAIYNTVAGQSIPNAAWTTINFDTRELDPIAAVTTGSAWHFTAPISGLYHVAATVGGGGTTGQRIITLRRNGAEVQRGNRLAANAAAGLTYCVVSGYVSLAAGDQVDVQFYQDSGGAAGLESSPSANRVSIVRVPGA